MWCYVKFCTHALSEPVLPRSMAPVTVLESTNESSTRAKKGIDIPVAIVPHSLESNPSLDREMSHRSVDACGAYHRNWPVPASGAVAVADTFISTAEGAVGKTLCAALCTVYMVWGWVTPSRVPRVKSSTIPSLCARKWEQEREFS